MPWGRRKKFQTRRETPVTFATDLRKFALLVALGACLFVGAASQASAQTVCVASGQSVSFNYASSSGPAVSAAATFTLAGSVLVVQYTNTSTEGAHLKGVGFNTAPRLASGSLAFAFATGGWAAGAGPGGGLGNFDLIAYGTGRNRLAPGASGAAVFIFASPMQEVCIQSTTAHMTNLPNGGDGKLSGVPSGTGGGGGPID
jgi:hypothetical protein